MAELEFPPIYLLAAHMDPDEVLELERQMPSLTPDISRAEVVVGKITKKERAVFELRRRKINTTELLQVTTDESQPSPKRRKLSASRLASGDDRSSTASGSDDVGVTSPKVRRQCDEPPLSSKDAGGIIKVVNLVWFTNSLSKGAVLPTDNYLVYQGRKEPQATLKEHFPKAVDILRRAKNEEEKAPASHGQLASSSHNVDVKHPRAPAPAKRPAFLKETTSEHDLDLDLPPIPAYLHTTYSCERPTPFDSQNEVFIEELKKIRTTRSLTGDKVGVRAYSTSIAALAAYPHPLHRALEVSRLPGCGPKIADLFEEWKSTGHIQEVENAAIDPHITVLKLFYDIWGVAETTARDFYNRGWRELDDIVEFGWSHLTRVQQIGVKYYDEFLATIPRAEVESIANTVLAQANRRRRGFHMVIVGGYRRGKQESGDVDVVLSHPDPDATHRFIEELVTGLEEDGFITHTLILSTKNSERGQAPLPWKGEDRNAGSGFDTLDKALVVWQDPVWDKSAHAKNPHPHRRVDVIISPWKTAGCAIIGWSGGTTFQRDLRRYCKAKRSLKFDSSGIRSRTTGQWVDLESDGGQPAPDLLTAEKRVFEGLGLEWREPTERCTG
ncbi:hypothetical protein JX266_004991 [Neoarthrinium moseri]|nr:hypothetical protein JX266_004991 [Neoarthrinium moseri]